MKMKGLARLRKAAHLTQAELAKQLGVGQTTVAAWESSAIWPSAERLPQLAEILNCSIEDLYREN